MRLRVITGCTLVALSRASSIGALVSGEDAPVTIFEKGIRIKNDKCVIYFDSLPASAASRITSSFDPCITGTHSGAPLMIGQVEFSIAQAVPSNLVRGYAGVVCRVTHKDGQKISKLAGVYARKATKAFTDSEAMNICRGLIVKGKVFDPSTPSPSKKFTVAPHAAPKATPRCFGDGPTLAHVEVAELKINSYNVGIELLDPHGASCIYSNPEMALDWQSVMSFTSFLEYFSRLVSASSSHHGSVSGLVSQVYSDSFGDSLTCTTSVERTSPDGKKWLRANTAYASYVMSEKIDTKWHIPMCETLFVLAQGANLIVRLGSRIVRLTGGFKAHIESFFTNSELGDLLVFKSGFYLFPKDRDMIAEVFFNTNTNEFKKIHSADFSLASFMNADEESNHLMCENSDFRKSLSIEVVATGDKKKVTCTIMPEVEGLGTVYGVAKYDSKYGPEVADCMRCVWLGRIKKLIATQGSSTAVALRIMN